MVLLLVLFICHIYFYPVKPQATFYWYFVFREVVVCLVVRAEIKQLFVFIISAMYYTVLHLVTLYPGHLSDWQIHLLTTWKLAQIPNTLCFHSEPKQSFPCGFSSMK